MAELTFIKCSKCFFAASDFQKPLEDAGLKTIDDIFAFNKGVNLSKPGLADYRNRLRFETTNPKAVLFLKRYEKPSISVQLKNWLSAKSRVSCAWFDYQVPRNLAAVGIGATSVIAYGEKFGLLFEKKSFCITIKIPDSDSLETRLPPCFDAPITSKKRKQKKEFIEKLAQFINKFHRTGYRHRDLYLCHIFYDGDSRFYLIDLARTFKPLVFTKRYRIKDIAQLYYSSPAGKIYRTDRMRFYHYLTGKNKLNAKDKEIIRKILRRIHKMAQHDKNHGRMVPCEK